MSWGIKEGSKYCVRSLHDNWACQIENVLFTTREAAWSIILVVSVCMYVCLLEDNFRNPRRRKFIFARAVYLHGLRAEFVYIRVKVKVAEAKKVENSYPRIVKLRSAITPVLSSILSWCLSAVWSRFSCTADRMVQPPYLSRDRKWTCVTKCTHSRVIRP